jgi:hypothetical protein
VKRLRARYLGYTPAPTAPITHEPHGIRERLHSHIATRGGGLIFAYQLARLDSGLILFGLALATMLLKQDFTWQNIALVSTAVSKIFN